MPELVALKTGMDSGDTARLDDDSVTCVTCGVVEPDEAAYQAGWQLVTPVCPDCLRWSVAEDDRE